MQQILQWRYARIDFRQLHGNGTRVISAALIPKHRGKCPVDVKVTREPFALCDQVIDRILGTPQGMECNGIDLGKSRVHRVERRRLLQGLKPLFCPVRSHQEQSE